MILKQIKVGLLKMIHILPVVHGNVVYLLVEVIVVIHQPIMMDQVNVMLLIIKLEIQI